MDITQLCAAIITLLAVLVSIFVVPTLKKKYGKAKIDEALEKANQVKYWIQTFVRAAEQKFNQGEGETKKSYVEKLINAKLSELNLKLDIETLDAQIEAAVLELKRAINS